VKHSVSIEYRPQDARLSLSLSSERRSAARGKVVEFPIGGRFDRAISSNILDRGQLRRLWRAFAAIMQSILSFGSIVRGDGFTWSSSRGRDNDDETSRHPARRASRFFERVLRAISHRESFDHARWSRHRDDLQPPFEAIRCDALSCER